MQCCKLHGPAKPKLPWYYMTNLKYKTPSFPYANTVTVAQNETSSIYNKEACRKLSLMKNENQKKRTAPVLFV